MKEYHKIQSVFKRDMQNKGRLLSGQWSLPEFEYLANNRWTFTEKVDGTNIRVMWDGEQVSFGGKTDNALIPAKLVATLRKLFPDGRLFASAFDGGGVCLYGEGYGAGIQNGGEYRPDQDFVLFDVRVGLWWLRREDVEDVARKMALDVVPVVGCGTLHECIDMVQRGFKSAWGNAQAEGIVARPVVELCGRDGCRIVAKVKCRDFR